MKKIALGISFAAMMALTADADVSKEDVKKLVAAGISDNVILTYVRANGPMEKLSPDDVIELKKAGATEKVLAAIVAKEPPPVPIVKIPALTYVFRRCALSFSLSLRASTELRSNSTDSPDVSEKLVLSIRSTAS